MFYCYICNVYCFLWILITPKLVESQIQSRQKNPLKYELTSEVIIFPQDYYGYDMQASKTTKSTSLFIMPVLKEIPNISQVNNKLENEIVQAHRLRVTKDHITSSNDVKNLDEAEKMLPKKKLLGFITSEWRSTIEIIEDKKKSDIKEKDRTYLKFLNIHDFTNFNDIIASTERQNTLTSSRGVTITTMIIATNSVLNESNNSFPQYAQSLSVRRQIKGTNVSIASKLHKVISSKNYIYNKYTIKFTTNKSFLEIIRSYTSDKRLDFSKQPRKVTILMIIPKELEYLKPILSPLTNTHSTVENSIESKPNLRANTTKRVRCYTCGLNVTRLGDDQCFIIFLKNPRTIYKNKKKLLKTRCPEEDVYKAGCFKRFIDFGEKYYERGCRTWPPARGVSFASKRLRSVELTLKNVANGCRFSPFASLIPLSRAISLYARFYACVCQGKLCNRDIVTKAQVVVILLCFLSYYCAFRSYS